MPIIRVMKWLDRNRREDKEEMKIISIENINNKWNRRKYNINIPMKILCKWWREEMISIEENEKWNMSRLRNDYWLMCRANEMQYKWLEKTSILSRGNNK